MKTAIARRDFLKLAGLATLSIFAPELSATFPLKKARSGSPNVLIFLFDALSARHLSLHGYSRETMPNIGRFAEGATVFHNHHATAPYTTPAVASLLTGTHTLKHRAFHLGQKTDQSFVNTNMFSKFHENGYNTIAYTHNLMADVLLKHYQGSLNTYKDREELYLNRSPMLARLAQNDVNAALQAIYRIFGDELQPGNSLFLSKIIETFWTVQSPLEPALLERFPGGLPGVQNSSIFFLLEEAIEWIARTLIQESTPTLGYFHLLPPHFPYSPPSKFYGHFGNDGYRPPSKPMHPLSNGQSDEELLTLRNRYDEYLLYVDGEFNRLMAELDDMGLAENSWIIFTSDHGELFERGWSGHQGLSLNHPVIHIPLIMKAPGQHGRKDIYEPTSHIDLLPTLEKVVGLPASFITDGTVLPTFGNSQVTSQRPVIVFNPVRSSNRGNLDKGMFSITQWPFKLIYYFGIDELPGGKAMELYNLDNDPEELEDLARQEQGVVTELLELLEDHIESYEY